MVFRSTGALAAFFFFEKIILFLNDAFERLTEEFTSVFGDEYIGSLNDFSEGRVLGGGPQVAEIGFGLFEKESFGFVLDFVGGIILFLAWSQFCKFVDGNENILANITYLTQSRNSDSAHPLAEIRQKFVGKTHRLDGRLPIPSEIQYYLKRLLKPEAILV